MRSIVLSVGFVPIVLFYWRAARNVCFIQYSHTCLLITYVQSHLAARQCLLPTLTATCHFQPPAQNTPHPLRLAATTREPPPRPHSPYRGGNVLAFCHFARFASVPCYKARRFSPSPHVLS
ncbi:rh178.3 [macacine betaherpesvirus 3]|uniref:Rh178.3 n=1 Tax=Rhesus cytomegalovirus (strain 68-1) TaxID=47929 RepID=Q2FAC1_RHCM6|nr:rh178.3 [macacine betaherpesvirus 3]